MNKERPDSRSQYRRAGHPVHPQPAAVHGRLREALGRAIAESFVAGYRLAMLISAGLALLSALCSLFLIEGKS